jgi:hypothetical protein
MRTASRLSIWLVALALTLGAMTYVVGIETDTKIAVAITASDVLMPSSYDRSGGDETAIPSSCSAIVHCNAIIQGTTIAIESPRADPCSFPPLPILAGHSAPPDPFPPKSSFLS